VFWARSLRERDNLKDPEVEGRIILKWILKKRWEGVYRIDLDQDMNE
jgi:hypothetical protein